MAQIQFKGKSFVQNHHLLVKYHELIPKKNKSLTKKVSLHDNLIVHGDNLKALKALLPLYAGKIKCIYIDPPYNTGNEKWVYNDNVNSPMMQEWLGKIVDREDLTRHDKWLCMMTPRLKLLRELLKDNGMIFISIDDNELHRLRMIMNEVFNEDNFMAQITVLCNPKGRVLSQGFAQTHEYLLAYRKTLSVKDISIEKTAVEIAEQYQEEDQLGYFRSLELRNTHRQFGKHNRPNLFFKIYCDPQTGKVQLKAKRGLIEILPIWDDGFEGCWTWSTEKVEAEQDKLLGKKIGNKWKVFRKAYAIDKEGKPAKKKPTTTWLDKEFHTEKGQAIVDKIFGERLFYAPKPVDLIKKLIHLSTDEDSIALDSFAGSGTTAHAVLALNHEDGGNRKFILVECEDYADKITAERVRKVIKGVPKAKDENLKKGLGGSFSYFELGKSIELESILSGDRLPTYKELARYVFYTATGEEFKPKAMNEKKNLVGESSNYKVYLFYKPDIEKLKNIALTLERAKSLGRPGKKRRLVFAPTKYLDQTHLDELRIDFAQLPFEIYELAR